MVNGSKVVAIERCSHFSEVELSYLYQTVEGAFKQLYKNSSDIIGCLLEEQNI